MAGRGLHCCWLEVDCHAEAPNLDRPGKHDLLYLSPSPLIALVNARRGLLARGRNTRISAVC